MFKLRSGLPGVLARSARPNFGPTPIEAVVGMALAGYAAGAGQRCEETWALPQCCHNRGAGYAGVDPTRPSTPRGSNMAKQELDWQNIDPATLAVEHQARYEAYKTAYRTMKEARDAFEGGMQKAAGLPQGSRLFFGYMFGKLSVAIGADTTKPAAKGKPAQSLEQFLASAQASGRRA